MEEVMITSSQNSLSSVVVAANALSGTPIISATTRESPGSSFLEGVVVATVMPKHFRIDWGTQWSILVSLQGISFPVLDISRISSAEADSTRKTVAPGFSIEVGTSLIPGILLLKI